MMRFLILLLLSFSIVVLPSCKNGTSKPINPFAQNTKTVPVPNTFSSQESYLGQTPGNYIPQTPAVLFPASSTMTPTQSPPVSSVIPSSVPSASVSASSSSKPASSAATLFNKTEKESDWSPVEVATTSQTAFQVMESKTQSTSLSGGFVAGEVVKTVSDPSESWVVGTSHVVTTVSDESADDLTEPQTLYSGKYAE